MNKTIDGLEAKLKQIQQELSTARKAEKAKKAKQRKRMAEIIGAYFLEKAEKEGSFKELFSTLEQKGLLSKKTDLEIFKAAFEEMTETAQDDTQDDEGGQESTDQERSEHDSSSTNQTIGQRSEAV